MPKKSGLLAGKETRLENRKSSHNSPDKSPYIPLKNLSDNNTEELGSLSESADILKEDNQPKKKQDPSNFNFFPKNAIKIAGSIIVAIVCLSLLLVHSFGTAQPSHSSNTNTGAVGSAAVSGAVHKPGSSSLAGSVISGQKSTSVMGSPDTGADKQFSAAEAEQLAEKWKQLRKQPSHFSSDQTGTSASAGTGFSEADMYDSEKHKVMKQLGLYLGKEGTLVSKVYETMGEPDELTADLANPFQQPSFMPGPVVPGEDKQEESMYACYYWRGRHDFLWFKLVPGNDGEEVVGSHGWYNNLE